MQNEQRRPLESRDISRRRDNVSLINLFPRDVSKSRGDVTLMKRPRRTHFLIFIFACFSVLEGFDAGIGRARKKKIHFFPREVAVFTPSNLLVICYPPFEVDFCKLKDSCSHVFSIGRRKKRRKKNNNNTIDQFDGFV